MSSKKPLPGTVNADKFTWEEGDLIWVSREANPQISVPPQVTKPTKKELPKK